jgi:NAD(P)-dependent dehydrogenase (short-subunit alcohol dehydrogenase family)
MPEPQRVALVTGANRGLGFEVARQLSRAGLKVLLTSRDGLSGKAAADKLLAEGADVAYFPLDVTKGESVRRASEYISNSFGRLDVLVNNAGVLLEGSPAYPQKGVLELSLEAVRASMETNVYGALRLCQALVPLMRRHRYGRIVNVSSSMAQLSSMKGGSAAYRMSKTALNALTRVLAAELENDPILINAVDPGWVRTRMGGTAAPRTPAEAAEGIVWAATLEDDGPSGGFFLDGQPLDW